MALAFWVDGRPGSPGGLIAAMCAHDEYLSLFSYYFAGKTQYMMTPNDDFYTAPFCYMPKNRKGGFVVFTTQVPWLDWNPLGESERAHHKAREYMELRGKHEKPYLGTVERFMTNLGLKERDIFTFTSDGCYPTKQDISQALEDKALEVTCAAMGWEIPENWRLIRKKEAETHGMPVLNLADWDQQKTSNGSNDGANVDVQIARKDDKHVDQREEKKESIDEYQC